MAHLHKSCWPGVAAHLPDYAIPDSRNLEKLAKSLFFISFIYVRCFRCIARDLGSHWKLMAQLNECKSQCRYCPSDCCYLETGFPLGRDQDTRETSCHPTPVALSCLRDSGTRELGGQVDASLVFGFSNNRTMRKTRKEQKERRGIQSEE